MNNVWTILWVCSLAFASVAFAVDPATGPAGEPIKIGVCL